MFNFQNKLNKNRIHYIFLFILSLNYLVPYVLFGNITLFYLDALDIEIPFNLVIGETLKGNISAIDIFLNNEIESLFLRRIFQPYSLFYSIFNLELAYWVIDILVKLVSYFSFYVLSKKINNNNLIASLLACLYASSNLPTHEGFGLAIFPYIIYLTLFKKELKLKHYLVIIFFGLNSDFIFTAFALPSLILTIFILQKKEKYINSIKILSLFVIMMIISNINLFLIHFQNIEFHRSDWSIPEKTSAESLKIFFTQLFNVPTNWNFTFFQKLPYSIYFIPIICLSFISKNKQVKKLLFIYIITLLSYVLIQHEFFSSFINNNIYLLKNFSWSYLLTSSNLLCCFLAIFIFKQLNIFTKMLFFLVSFSILLFQINSSIVPFYKEKFLKMENYQNIYTFKGYYNFYDYDNIKDRVGTKRVMSVGLDPMVATVHKIYVIDGYHTLYPLSYKEEFKKIIRKELEKNATFANYFNTWGSRVYTTLFEPYDKDNFELDYIISKKIGADFVISKFHLNSKDLITIFEDCDKSSVPNRLCLYQIK